MLLGGATQSRLVLLAIPLSKVYFGRIQKNACVPISAYGAAVGNTVQAIAAHFAASSSLSDLRFLFTLFSWFCWLFSR